MSLLFAGQKARVEVEALPELGDEGLAVDGIPDRAGGDRHHALGPEFLVAGHVVGDDAADAINRVRAQGAAVLHAAPEVGDGGPPLDLAYLGPLDVGDQQPGRVRPDVDDGDSHRGHVILDGSLPHRASL